MKKHPVDFDLIDYGDVVPNAVLVDYYGIAEDDDSFRFTQVRFIQYLDRELRSRHKVRTICIRDGVVVILTPEEAAEYNRKRFNNHISGLAKSHEKNIHVEREYLTDIDKDKHDRTVMFQSKILQSVVNVKSDFQIEVTERKSPGFIDMNYFQDVKIIEGEKE